MLLWRFWRLRQDKRVRAIFMWLQKRWRAEDILVISYAGKEWTYTFAFPFQPGDMPRAVVADLEKATFALVIGDQVPTYTEDPDWAEIYTSRDFSVWERWSRHKKGIAPLYLGLSEKEKKMTLRIARQVLAGTLTDPSSRTIRDILTTCDIPPRFRLTAGVGVALWHAGIPRGSQYFRNISFVEGVAHAAVAASQDVRFSALHATELSDTRIEITVFREPAVPIMSTAYKQAPDAQHAFLLEQGSHFAAYLPEIYNVGSFRTQHAVLHSLAQEKLGRGIQQNDRAVTFCVTDWIESERIDKLINLNGPIPELQGDGSRDVLYARAAKWLKGRLQDERLPMVIDPRSGNLLHAKDTLRTLFSLSALAAYGRAYDDREATQIAGQQYPTGKKMLIEQWEDLPFASQVLAGGYAGHLALRTKNTDDMRVLAHNADARLLSLGSRNVFERANITSFLFAAGAALDDCQFVVGAAASAEQLWKDFQRIQNDPQTETAAIAEIARVFHLLHVQTSSPTARWWETAVVEWLIARQNNDGSFRASNREPVPYTRGTSKVYEVLAGLCTVPLETVERTHAWLAAMQYDSRERSFFIPEERWQEVCGGFRATLTDMAMWVDVNAHVLIGAARLANHFPSDDISSRQ